jgi:hypothetical protein
MTFVHDKAYQSVVTILDNAYQTLFIVHDNAYQTLGAPFLPFFIFRILISLFFIILSSYLN